jgi:1-acyl-sn-glycerol-3-phosphate acyltransferase
MKMIHQLQEVAHWSEAAQNFVAQYLKASSAPANTLTGLSLDDRDPQVIEQLLPFVDWVYHHYFRVQTDGWEHIPDTGKLLLVGSHNGGLAAPDTVMTTYKWLTTFGTERLAYALMEPNIWRMLPGLARLATQVGTLQAHSHMAIAALERNAALLIYPGGMQDVFRPHALRHSICFFGQKGFIKLALMQEAPIIPVISHGAHDTLFVLADLYPHIRQLHDWGMPWPLGIDPGTFPLYLGLPWGLAIGPLPNIPLPMPMHIRICPMITFDRYGHDAVHDHDYVDACYEHVRQTMQHELDRLVQDDRNTHILHQNSKP